MTAEAVERSRWSAAGERGRLGAPARRRHAIGYLLPEFPTQTHAFFWRELNALESLGIDVEIVSTRRPRASEICHHWSGQACRRTVYLYPPTARGVAAAGLTMGSSPEGVGRCLGVAREAGVRGVGRVRALGLMAMGARLARIARRMELDHIHVHSCADAAFVALFSNLLGGPPYSLTLHGDVDGYGPGQDVKWGHAAFGFVVTAALMPGLRRAAPGLDESRVLVAPMGVDVGTFTRSGPYEPAGFARARVVCCGRLHPLKGQLDLVRAAAGLREAGISAEVRLIGDGPARGEILREAERLRVTDRVALLGALPESGVREELERAHVFALPSHAEAVGVATMEAMAMGLPVVVAGVGGVPELVRHGVDGLVVPAGDHGALVGALRTVITDGELARRMGENGARRIRAHFHSGVSASRLAGMLDTLYGGAPEPALAARNG